MVDPTGIANWSVTHVDWSEGKWHPKAYRAQDISYELLKNITVRILSCFTKMILTVLSTNFSSTDTVVIGSPLMRISMSPVMNR